MDTQQEGVVRQRVATPGCEDLVKYRCDSAPTDADTGLRATGNPLMLSMYISLFKSRRGEAMPGTVAELYARAAKPLLDPTDEGGGSKCTGCVRRGGGPAGGQAGGRPGVWAVAPARAQGNVFKSS